MTLPSTSELQIQILNALNDQSVHGLPELKDILARKFEISADDRKKVLKSKRPLFDKRIIDSLTMLRKSGFIVNQKRANFKITKTGLNRLKSI